MDDTATTRERTATSNQQDPLREEAPPLKLTGPFAGASIIHTYTRKQAIDDGVLIDVSETAREAGFKVPTVLTQGAWNECVQWSEADSERQKTHQDESGRLWDVLWMAGNAMRAAVQRNPGAGTLIFQLLCVPRTGPTEAVEQSLKVMIHGGDNAEAVATILLPNED